MPRFKQVPARTDCIPQQRPHPTLRRRNADLGSETTNPVRRTGRKRKAPDTDPEEQAEYDAPSLRRTVHFDQPLKPDVAGVVYKPSPHPERRPRKRSKRNRPDPSYASGRDETPSPPPDPPTRRRRVERKTKRTRSGKILRAVSDTPTPIDDQLSTSFESLEPDDVVVSIERDPPASDEYPLDTESAEDLPDAAAEAQYATGRIIEMSPASGMREDDEIVYEKEQAPTPEAQETPRTLSDSVSVLRQNQAEILRLMATQSCYKHLMTILFSKQDASRERRAAQSKRTSRSSASGQAQLQLQVDKARTKLRRGIEQLAWATEELLRENDAVVRYWEHFTALREQQELKAEEQHLLEAKQKPVARRTRARRV